MFEKWDVMLVKPNFKEDHKKQTIKQTKKVMKMKQTRKVIKKTNSLFSKKPDLDEEVTDEREESYIEETDVAGDKQTVPWLMKNGLALGSSKSAPSEDNSRPGNGMNGIQQPVDRNEFELYAILGAQAVLVEDTVARESRVPARDGPA